MGRANATLKARIIATNNSDKPIKNSGNIICLNPSYHLATNVRFCKNKTPLTNHPEGFL
jgi:hypothetical protein